MTEPDSSDDMTSPSSQFDYRGAAPIPQSLPVDQRMGQGGKLFLISLTVFFVSSIMLFAFYAESRQGDPQTTQPLPNTFLISTVCLLVISVLVHVATRSVRRQLLGLTAWLLLISAAAAVLFMVMQCFAMVRILDPQVYAGRGRGVAGMVVVLAVLHALHVLGGVVALVVVAIGSQRGRYDHERHWPVDFAAQYWHFLDAVWLCMLAAFWMTTGGFDL